MINIAIINEKGGVGKTTSTINIGAALSLLGKKVLLIDIDPQENLTNSLGFQGHNLKKNLYHLLIGEASIDQVILDRKIMKVIPSSRHLAELQIKMAYINKENLLKNHLYNLEGFDYTIIDCPANLGILAQNALVAADEVYITLQSEFLALQGMAKLSKLVNNIRETSNKNLEIGGVIATRYDKRKRLNNEVITNIKEFFGDKFFKTIIRENIALAEAPSFGKTIFEYRKNSHGAEDYLHLAMEILERDKSKDQKNPKRKRLRLSDFMKAIEAQEKNN